VRIVGWNVVETLLATDSRKKDIKVRRGVFGAPSIDHHGMEMVPN